MKVLNIARMRKAIADVRVATPFGQEAKVDLLLEDLEGMTDEIELARTAVHESAEALDFSRAVLKDCLSMISKPANRARITAAIAKIDLLVKVEEEHELTPEEAAEALRRAARARLYAPDGRRFE